jgi:hypothetical protein
MWGNVLFAFVVALIAFYVYRGYVRRRSLHRRDDGTYVWVEWHGGEMTSSCDPSAPGGAWDSGGDSGGDGGGDGGGGD